MPQWRRSIAVFLAVTAALVILSFVERGSAVARRAGTGRVYLPAVDESDLSVGMMNN